MNTPTLTQSEEERAPWNIKSIPINISQTLSAIEYIEVPENFNEEDEEVLKELVIEQVILPSEAIAKYSDRWCVDDFCVTL